MYKIRFEYTDKLCKLIASMYNNEPFESCYERIKDIADINKGNSRELFLVFIYNMADVFCDKEFLDGVFGIVEEYGAAYSFFRTYSTFYDHIYWLKKLISGNDEEKKNALKFLQFSEYSEWSRYTYEQLMPFLMLGNKIIVKRILQHRGNYSGCVMELVYYELRNRRTEIPETYFELIPRMDHGRALRLACEDPEFFYSVVQYKFRNNLPEKMFNPDGSVKTIRECVEYVFSGTDDFEKSSKASCVEYLYTRLDDGGFQRVKQFLPRIELLRMDDIILIDNDSIYAEIISELAGKEIFIYNSRVFCNEYTLLKNLIWLLPKCSFYIDEQFILNKNNNRDILKWLKLCARKNVFLWKRESGAIFGKSKIPFSASLADAYFRAGAIYSECYDEFIELAAEHKAFEMLNLLNKHKTDIENLHICIKNFPDDYIENECEKAEVCIEKPVKI